MQVTEEDKHRTALYAQRVERTRLETAGARPWRSSSPRCNSRSASHRCLPDQLPRVAQLTQRTNQMNFTTVRRTEADLQALLRSGTPSA